MATIYYTACSVDGYIADQHNSLAWLDGRSRNEGTESAYDTFIQRVGALCMGRTTYDWILEHHPEFASEPIYAQPAWVLSHRELDVTAPGVQRHCGDVRQLHAAMSGAADGKDLWVIGGGDVVGQFADAGLLDEVWVQFAPVTLGGGAPLLPRRLELEILASERNGDFSDVRYRVLPVPAPRP